MVSASLTIYVFTSLLKEERLCLGHRKTSLYSVSPLSIARICSSQELPQEDWRSPLQVREVFLPPLRSCRGMTLHVFRLEPDLRVDE